MNLAPKHFSSEPSTFANLSSTLMSGQDGREQTFLKELPLSSQHDCAFGMIFIREIHLFILTWSTVVLGIQLEVVLTNRHLFVFVQKSSLLGNCDNGTLEIFLTTNNITNWYTIHRRPNKTVGKWNQWQKKKQSETCDPSLPKATFHCLQFRIILHFPDSKTPVFSTTVYLKLSLATRSDFDRHHLNSCWRKKNKPKNLDTKFQSDGPAVHE